MIRGIAEILSEISKIKNFEQQKAALVSCRNNTALMQLLHATFHPDVKFLLPEGRPPFKPTEKSMDLQASLYRESRKMHYFIEGLSPPLPQLKRETLFVQLLEVLDPDDVNLVLGMKDKTMIYPGITYDLVYQTFPGMLPDPNAVKNVVEDRKPKNQRGRKAVPCPHGCKSSHEDGLFAINTIGIHMKKVHGSSNEGVETK
jgi:hypothetical protein